MSAAAGGSPTDCCGKRGLTSTPRESKVSLSDTGLETLLLEKSLETSRYFTCEVCSDQLVEPRVIRCGHSFCHRCLDEHLTHKAVDNHNRKTCPICPKRIANRSYLKASNVDFLLSSYSNEAETSSEDSQSVQKRKDSYQKWIEERK